MERFRNSMLKWRSNYYYFFELLRHILFIYSVGRGHWQWLAGLVALLVRRQQEGVEASLPCPRPSVPTTRLVVVIVAAAAASTEEAKVVKPIGGNEGRQPYAPNARRRSLCGFVAIDDADRYAHQPAQHNPTLMFSSPNPMLSCLSPA